MKACSIFLWLLLLVCVGRSQPSGGLKDMQGRSIFLDSLSNQKLLIVVLPAKADTGIIGQLLRFQSKYIQQIKVIGLVSPGTASMGVDSNGYSRLLAAGVWLTEGMAAGDSVVSIRQSVFKYISNKSRNRLVDRFAEGSKYFLSEKGRLFAQLESNTSLDSRVAGYLVQTKVPGEGH